MTYLGLYALQHRGQESTGIVSLRGKEHLHHKGLGLVGEVYKENDLLRLEGNAACGHNRYSTHGGNLITNAQPITANLKSGPIAIAHNGNFTNADALREELIEQGAIFQGTNDTEVLLHLIALSSEKNIIQAIKTALKKIEGAYSIVILTEDKLIAFRDQFGYRPMVLGERPIEDNKQSIVIASETCAFDLIGATFVRAIEPGEIFWVDSSGTHSESLDLPLGKTKHCVFEHVYFSRPDSVVYGRSVYESRKAMGRELAKESPVEADIVIPVPDSGVPAAIGYSNESGLPFELGIIRNHYIGRTFIQPSQSIRSFGVKIKLNPQSEILKGRRVVVIDDSLVRGTTSQKIIQLIRAAGAKEVHFRLASPPTVSPCYYGVDTPRRSQLIASEKTVEEIREFIGADSLAYLSHEGLLRAVEAGKQGYCMACFED
jgi:amidophosphoribosyltransferase